MDCELLRQIALKKASYRVLEEILDPHCCIQEKVSELLLLFLNGQIKSKTLGDRLGKLLDEEMESAIDICTEQIINEKQEGTWDY